MATTNSKYGIKRTIFSNRYDEEDYKAWKEDMMEANDMKDGDTSEDVLRSWYNDDVYENYMAEQSNLDQEIDGYIIALGHRWSHYGAICGNGRSGVAMCGNNLNDIFILKSDIMEYWGQDYNIQGRTADHDGSWSFDYRVCKSKEEAEKFIDKDYSNDEIMARTKSLYPYIAKIYGWPYRKTKGAA